MKNSKYLKFLSENFKFINIEKISEKNFSKLENIYKEVESIFIILILIKKNCSKILKIDFIEIITNHLLGLLLCIPNNFHPSIDFCFRGAIEGMIKFIYQNKIGKNMNYKDISKIGYRNLKDELKKEIKKEYLNSFYSLYSDYSNSLHIKNKTEIDISETINEIIKELDYNYETLEKNLNIFFNSLIVIIDDVYKINGNNFPLEDRIYLKKKLSNSKYKKIMKED